jgi:glutamyl-tRNA reductase
MFLLPFSMVGVSHETNHDQLVGGARLLPERQTSLLNAMRERGVPAVLLSTCHRTELYWWGELDLEPWFAEHILMEQRSVASIERRDADLAVRHLFAVAAGMHARRFGEPEVLGQVRQAWRTAQEAETTSPDLDAIFRQAIDASRHIRLAIGVASQASLGACARAAFEASTRCVRAPIVRVLVVGAGDAARSVLDAFATPDTESSGFAVAVTSRTDARAEHVGAQHGATPVAWSGRESAMRAADVVVFAAHASTPLVRDAQARGILAGRAAPTLWIDLGVPGNVHLDAPVPHLRVVTLDELEGQQPQDRARHLRATSALQRELARFSAMSHRRRLGAQLAHIERRALCAVRDAMETADAGEPAAHSAEVVARRVTRVLLREFSALS